MDQMISDLSYILSVFKAIIPFSLQELVDRGFQPFSSYEGYELLNYLLVACGISLDINPTLFKHLGRVSLKDRHPDDKMIIERHKGDILEAVKMLTKKIYSDIKPLRKSDLMLPFCAKYFSCCLALSHFAINFLLEKFGISFKIESPLAGISKDNFLQFCESLTKQEMEMESESKLLFIQADCCLQEILNLHSEIEKFKEKKNEISFLIHEEIKGCPLEYSEQLKDLSTRNDAIASLSKYLNRKSLSNNNKITELKEMDIKLKMLNNFMNVGIKKNVLDGNDFASLISDEDLLFADKNKIDLLDGNRFNISALMKIVSLSNANNIIDLQRFSNVIGFESSIDDSGLYERLKNVEEKVAAEILELRSSIDTSIDPDIHESWLKEFFTTVPALEISNDLLPSPVFLHEPFVDLEKIESILKA